MLDPRPSPAGALAPLALLLCLTGCAGGASSYPSLAPRPIEQLSLAEPSRAEASPAVPSTQAAARFAPFVQRARDADDGFRETLEAERPALVRGQSAPEGSDAWTAAQLSLSRIETARGVLGKVLTDLDAARDAPDTAADTGTAIAAAQAFDAVQQIDGSEQQALEAAWQPGER